MGDLSVRWARKKTGAPKHPCSSSAMSRAGYPSAWVLSSRASLRFAGYADHAMKEFRRASSFQRMATCGLTGCLSPRVHSTMPFCGFFVNTVARLVTFKRVLRTFAASQQRLLREISSLDSMDNQGIKISSRCRRAIHAGLTRTRVHRPPSKVPPSRPMKAITPRFG